MLAPNRFDNGLRHAVADKNPPTLSTFHSPRSILKSWVGHYNHGRPHMAIGPGVPDPPSAVVQLATQLSRHRIGERLVVHVQSVLGGLHHEYSLAPALA
jgi:hypothetical protein